MAEVVEFLLVKIVSLIKNEALILLGGGAHHEFNEIKRELESMKSFLKDADRKRGINEGVRSWVDQIQDIAYDVADIIDEFVYFIDSQHSGSGNLFLCFFHKTIHLPRNFKMKHQMATKLQRIKTDIIAISERSKRYGFHRIKETAKMSSRDHDARAILQHHGESSLFIGDDDLVGIYKERDLLLKRLVGGERERTVVSVFGMGGSGKTTLVGKVYNNQTVKNHFGCHAWITVSQTYLIEDLLRSMIKEFSKVDKELAPDNLSTMDYRWLVEKLVNHLQHKRYVVILDDVWDINLWSQISVALPNSSHGSRIMLTTRKEEIARFSFGVRSYAHPIQPLQQSEAWVLFCKKAFSVDPPNGCCPPELEGLARVLVEKCEGLPLAIVSMGGLMSSKTRTEFEWRRVRDSLNWELSNNSMLDRVKRILLLSFNDLPYYLRQCFLYCCIFPEDYYIKRKRLIKLWIAEGFVKERKGMILEEVADTYLMDLIRRSMLQVVEKNYFGRAKSCRMHDIIRELALSISEREKLCEVYDDRQQETREEGRKTHRLSLHIRDETSQVRLQIHWYQLRSFIAFYNLPLNTMPSGFRLLRVLDLRGIPIERVPDEIVELFNLRYLNLRRTQIKELPKSLGKLRNLQFLDILLTKVEALPSSIAKLQNLRYLTMLNLEDEGMQVPLDVCKLKHLQGLGVVKAESNLIRQVGGMTQLTKFGITNVRAADERELCSSIQKMHLLRTLVVRVNNNEESLQMDALYSPPPILQNLLLHGKLEKVPRWVHSLENLVYLGLYLSRLNEDILSHIHALPKLHKLVLISAYGGQQLHFRAGGFLKLKTLHLWSMPQLNEVIIEKQALPSISLLYIVNCKELKMVPQGIENLVNLQKLQLQEVSNVLVENICGEDRPKVRHIPHINLYRKASSGWTNESLSCDCYDGVNIEENLGTTCEIGTEQAERVQA